MVMKGGAYSICQEGKINTCTLCPYSIRNRRPCQRQDFILTHPTPKIYELHTTFSSLTFVAHFSIYSDGTKGTKFPKVNDEHMASSISLGSTSVCPSIANKTIQTLKHVVLKRLAY